MTLGQDKPRRQSRPIDFDAWREINPDIVVMTDTIGWLLFESGETRYKISEATGIPESTLSRIATGRHLLRVLRLEWLADYSDMQWKLRRAIWACRREMR